MEKMLIASDYDGTFGTGEQLAKDADAVRRFRKAGHVFGLVSGRNASALKYVQSAGKIEHDFLLSDNGGNCRVDGKTLFCRLACASALVPLCEYLMSKNTKLIAVNRPDGADMFYYRHGDGRTEFSPARPLWQNRPFTQVSAYFDTLEKSFAAADEINALFPRLEALPNGGCLDVIPRGSGKDVGVLAVARLFSVCPENVFTVGDNFNDLPMLTAFGGFAVARAPERVRQIAPRGVVASVEELILRLLEK